MGCAESHLIKWIFANNQKGKNIVDIIFKNEKKNVLKFYQ